MDNLSFKELIEKMEVLLAKVESIEQKIIGNKDQYKSEVQLDFPMIELVTFKKELEEIKQKMANPNQQVLDITMFNMLKELANTTNEIKESTGFVKQVFTQEKVKPMKRNISKQDAVHGYLRKYVKSMK